MWIACLFLKEDNDKSLHKTDGVIIVETERTRQGTVQDFHAENCIKLNTIVWGENVKCAWSDAKTT